MPQATSGTHLRSWFLTGWLLLSAGGISAQTAERPVGGLRLDSWEGWIGLEALYRDEQRVDDFSSIDQDEVIWREDVGLRLRGSYYHRRFLEYDLRGAFGLEQRDEDSSSGISSFESDSTNLAYDLQFLLFKELPYSAEAYANRSEARTRQTFFETTEAIITEAGVNLRASELWIPSTLQVSRYVYDGRGLDTFEEQRERVLLSGNRFTDGDSLQYAAEFSQVQQGPAALTFDDLNLNASASLRVGSDPEDRWTNSARFRSQTGDLDNENSGLTSTLRYALGEDLGGTTDLSYSRTESGPFTTEVFGASTGLDHQLYDSLTSSGSVRASHNTFDDGVIDRHGALLDLSYSKSVPGGTLRIRSSEDFYIQDEENDSGVVQVLDEVHVNVVGTPIFLDNRNVDVTTILVTDFSGLLVFTEGSDYLVSVQSGRTRLDIPPGSLIAPGQTILVDYSFVPNPDLRFSSFSYGLDVGLRLWGFLDVSVGRYWVDQDRLSGIDDGFLEDSVRTSARMSVAGDRTSVGIDYEDLESEFIPYTRTSLNASYDGPSIRGLAWRLGGIAARTHYPDDDDNERSLSATTNLFYRLTENSSLDLRAEWREIDLRSDDGTGILVEARWARNFRTLSFLLAARFSHEEFEVASDQRLSEVTVTVKRTF